MGTDFLVELSFAQEDAGEGQMIHDALVASGFQIAPDRTQASCLVIIPTPAWSADEKCRSAFRLARANRLLVLPVLPSPDGWMLVGLDASKAGFTQSGAGLDFVFAELRSAQSAQKQTGQSGRPFKFKAFLSYSHGDKRTARWLHRALETYKIPRALRLAGGAGKPAVRLGRFFRDDEELRGAADLGSLIRGALEESEHLVILCSPKSAASPWVDAEIRDFKRLHGENRIVPVIVSGTPHSAERECFPPALKVRVSADGVLTDTAAEPIAVDLRKFGRRDTLLKVIAGLLGIDFDALKKRERARRTRRLAAWGSVAAIVIAAGLYGAGAIVEQQSKRAWGVIAQTARADTTANLASLWATLGALATPSSFYAPTQDFDPIFQRALGDWRLETVDTLPDQYSYAVFNKNGNAVLLAGLSGLALLDLTRAPREPSSPLAGIDDIIGLTTGPGLEDFLAVSTDAVRVVELRSKLAVRSTFHLTDLVATARTYIPANEKIVTSSLGVKRGSVLLQVESVRTDSIDIRHAHIFRFDGKDVNPALELDDAYLMVDGKVWRRLVDTGLALSEASDETATFVLADSSDRLVLENGAASASFLYDSARGQVIGSNGQIWEYPSGRLLRTVTVTDRVMPVEERLFDDARGRVLIRAGDGLFAVLDLETGSLVQDLQLDLFAITAMAMSSNNDTLIAASAGGRFYVWRPYAKTSVSLSAKAREICSALPRALANQDSEVWNLQTRELLKRESSSVSNLAKCPCPQQRRGGVSGAGLLAPGFCEPSKTESFGSS